MPKMPKWLGDFSEKAFKSSYSPVTVTEVQYFTEELKLICFQGDALKSKKWTPAQVIEFRINDTDYRHYTPMRWDTQKGCAYVLFYLHQQGVGSHWASNLKVGDTMNLIGPGGKFTVPDEVQHIVMFGDETTLGAFYGMINSLPQNTKSWCILEMENTHLDWAEKIDLQAITLTSDSKNRGQATVEWLNNFLDKNNTDEFLFFLSGNANAIKLIFKTLKSAGISPKKVKTSPYWAEGKKGL